MASRDLNHATIVRLLQQAGASVVDLSGVGGGCPDLLVGYAGNTALVEIKVPARVVKSRRLASTRCAECGHNAKKHETCGPCIVCECSSFELDLKDDERTFRRGRLSKNQTQFQAKWAGCPIFVVEDESGVEAVLMNLDEEGDQGND